MRHLIFVGAMLAASCSIAVAQSSVVLFGTVDAGVHKVTNGAVGSITSLISAGGAGGNSSSRWGMRGTEDLGGGLSASFHLESTVSVDTGAMTGFDRRSTVSLASASWGEVRLGRDYVSTHTVFCSFDFGGGCVGTASPKTFDDPVGNRVLAGSGANVSRANNSVQWLSPAWGGVSGAVLYSFDEGANSASNAPQGRGLRLGYSAGPLRLAAAAYRVGNTREAVFEDAAIGGSYDFNLARVALSQRTYTWGAEKIVASRLLVTAPVGGNGLVRAAVMRADQSGATAAANGSDATMWSLGYVHTLSKRTALYGSVGQISNEGAAIFTIAGGPPVTTANFGGSASKAWEFGLRHFF